MRHPFRCLTMLLLASAAQASISAYAASASFTIANNTPGFVSTAKQTSAVDPNQVIDVTLWLKPKNRAAFDSTVAKLYDRSSPSFHKWLTPESVAALVAPSKGEADSVEKFLKAGNLTIVSRDKFNYFVRARGTVADIQKAFSVQLANVTLGSTTVRTNLADPAIADAAGEHVQAIEGLDNIAFAHHNIAQLDALKGAHAAPSAKAALAAPAASAAPPACIGSPATETFTTAGAPPSATITGNKYNTGTLGCGYTPPQIQAAYGLTSLYAKGLDGTGQTIVIVDWCGEETIKNDANAFSKKYGLPALTSSNFAIVNYPAPSQCAAPDPEINIDVEWAHAIAPGANILLLVPPTPEFVDIDSSLLYIVENGLGNVVSNSYGAEESEIDPAIISTQNFIIEAAASVGISMNFSSGDDGDFTFGFPKFIPPSVSNPADSPYATAIGGVSLQMTANSTVQFQVGWGTNEALVSEPGFVPVPAAKFGFNFGSGGGTSAVFAKPAYQKALKGKFRKLPDISWLADPFTGAYIAISEPFTSPAVTYQVYGGTSLACPMFSGLWAIANQAAGSSLGLAAPALYAAPASTITDIVPLGSPTNVTATYTKANGQTLSQDAATLIGHLEGSSTFISAFWDYPLNQNTTYVLSFGTDTGLKTATGWDDVTGLGVANPAALITAVTPSATRP